MTGLVIVCRGNFCPRRPARKLGWISLKADAWTELHNNHSRDRPVGRPAGHPANKQTCSPKTTWTAGTNSNNNNNNKLNQAHSRDISGTFSKQNPRLLAGGFDWRQLDEWLPLWFVVVGSERKRGRMLAGRPACLARATSVLPQLIERFIMLPGGSCLSA